jgi:hypothetical protein
MQTANVPGNKGKRGGVWTATTIKACGQGKADAAAPTGSSECLHTVNMHVQSADGLSLGGAQHSDPSMSVVLGACFVYALTA